MEEIESHFIESSEAQLLVGEVLDGLILLTKRGDSIYSCGNLKDLDEKYYSQFLIIFNITSEEEGAIIKLRYCGLAGSIKINIILLESTLCQKGFILQTGIDACEHKYIIYSKNFCSVYAVTRNNRSGIIVCNLPYGIVVATYSFPCTSVKAIDIVEKACELLRG